MTKRRELRDIKDAAGEFYREALLARREYLDMRLRQDAEVKKIYVRSVNRIAAAIRRGGNRALRQRQLPRVHEVLQQETKLLNGDLMEAIRGYIEQGVSASSKYSQAVLTGMLEKAGEMIRSAQATGENILIGMPDEGGIPRITKTGVEQMFFRVNKEAVEAVWERTHKGLNLSDRIWDTSEKSRNGIANVIQDAVATGQDAVTTARMLEQYVQKGAGALGRYEGMTDRMRGRVPGNVSYNAMRLARTETSAAFGQGTIRAAQASPATLGIKYCLSSAHIIIDICDELAARDQGLGPGVYPKHAPPLYPAHPNTMSYLIQVKKDLDGFADELKQWVEDYDSQPELNSWYENYYKKGQDYDIIKKHLDVQRALNETGIDVNKIGLVTDLVPRAIKVIRPYAAGRLAERGITGADAQRYIDKALVCFRQADGRKTAYYSEEGIAVVLTTGDRLNTAWPARNFDPDAKTIIKVAKEVVKKYG